MPLGSLPLPKGNAFQDPQWMPEATDIYISISISIYICDIKCAINTYTYKCVSCTHIPMINFINYIKNINNDKIYIIRKVIYLYIYIYIYTLSQNILLYGLTLLFMMGDDIMCVGWDEIGWIM
jgi:hypothetical protein